LSPSCVRCCCCEKKKGGRLCFRCSEGKASGQGGQCCHCLYASVLPLAERKERSVLFLLLGAKNGEGEFGLAAIRRETDSCLFPAGGRKKGTAGLKGKKNVKITSAGKKKKMLSFWLKRVAMGKNVVAGEREGRLSALRQKVERRCRLQKKGGRDPPRKNDTYFLSLGGE